MAYRVRAQQLLFVAAIAFSISEVRMLAQTSGQNQPSQDRVYLVTEGMALPTPIRKVEPTYTRRAASEKVQGSVLLSIVVTPEGNVDQIRVVRKLHPDLDQKAIEAVQQWKFEPAIKAGEAVPCSATVEVHFRLLDQQGSPPPIEEPRKTNRPSGRPKAESSAVKSGRAVGAEPLADNKDSASETGESKTQRQEGNKDVDFFGSQRTALDDSRNQLRLRSEHFQLISSWKNENQLGQLLLALERARALFLHLYEQVPTGVVTVVVNESLAETRSACRTSQGVGCYSSRSGAHSIILSKDAFNNGATAPAVHEYTHLVQDLIGYASAPPWVNEGIAGYYENVEFKQGKLYVGYFNPQRPIPAWVSVDALLAMDYATLKDRVDRKGTQGFYAESHLLIHMLRHTPRYSARLGELLGAIKKGNSSRETFLQFYGVSPNQLNDELVDYYRRGQYRKVEIYAGVKVPDTVTVEGVGQKVVVKERKCTWCGVRNVMRHVPIIIPIP